MEKIKEAINALLDKIGPLASRVRDGWSKLGDRLRPMKERVSPALKQVASKTKLAWEKTAVTFSPVTSRTKEFLNRTGIGPKCAELWNRVAPKRSLSISRLKGMEPAAMLAAVSAFFQRRGASLFGKTLTVTLCAYFLADVAVWLLDRSLPETPALRASRRLNDSAPPPPNPEMYNVVVTRNLFNSQGLIPGEEAPGQDRGGQPVRTTLPFKLVGTLVLRDELRSIATIEDSSASTIYPVRMQDEIPGKAKILSIEARKVIFVNTSSGRREFLELPEDLSATAPRISVGGAAKTGGISQTAPNNYVISRSKVDEAFKDLNSILTQAKCVPNHKGGAPAGFRCFQIVKGSIYDQLGMKDDDVICGLNGQPVNDINKAVELLNELRTANDVELCIERNGVQQNFAYSVQ